MLCFDCSQSSCECREYYLHKHPDLESWRTKRVDVVVSVCCIDDRGTIRPVVNNKAKTRKRSRETRERGLRWPRLQRGEPRGAAPPYQQVGSVARGPPVPGAVTQLAARTHRDGITVREPGSSLGDDRGGPPAARGRTSARRAKGVHRRDACCTLSAGIHKVKSSRISTASRGPKGWMGGRDRGCEQP